MNKSVAFPETIRIGGIDFSVEVIKDLRDGNMGLNGHILYNDGTIKVEEDMTDMMQFTVVWHEVLHGILEQSGLEEHSEAMIVALGYGVAAALRDNEYLRLPPDARKAEKGKELSIVNG